GSGRTLPRAAPSSATATPKAGRTAFSSARLDQDVAGVAHRLDALAAGPFAELLAEIGDVHVDGAVVGREPTTEDQLAQVFAGHHRAGALHQHLQQVVLRGRQVELARTHAHTAGGRYELQVIDTERLRHSRGAVSDARAAMQG